MSVKCLNCGYEMSLWQESTSTVTHVATGILGIINKTKEQLGSGVFAGPMNHKIGDSEGVKCPNCGKVGCWKDI